MLTWLTAWTRLIVDDATALEVANHAVARAASRRKRLTGTALKLAARHEAALLLARGVAAAPQEHGHHTPASSPYVEPSALAYAPSAATMGARADEWDPRTQTAVGRLEIALETLAPYERLACVSYFLDGVSTDAIATLLDVPRERAVRILEHSAPTIARAVGEYEIPDFSVATDEIEVVTL